MKSKRLTQDEHLLRRNLRWAKRARVPVILYEAQLDPEDDYRHTQLIDWTDDKT